MKIGIVGLPNVGKSTLFKALTKKEVVIENYPFATIDPNVGVVAVPDARLDALTALSKSEKTIPTSIEFVDIAGLVAGAHQGEGLGNQFLSHIREVDAIAEVVRDFIDPDIHHVNGTPDPERDQITIELELAMADAETLQKRISATEGKAKSGDKDASLQLAVYTKLYNAVREGMPARSVVLNEDEQYIAKLLNLLTSKPLIIVKNVSEADVAKRTKAGELAISAKIEAELAELDSEEAATYLKDLGLEQSGLDRLITECYSLLNLITYLTTGPKETRAWTVTAGSTAPIAAGKIHTDFIKGFIAAEVINWADLIEAGSEAKAREKGLLRLEGKTYIVQDGDVCNFKIAPVK